MDPEKPKLSRAGTMKTTAEEGAEFLERQGFDWKTGGSTFITDDSDGSGKEERDISDTDEPSEKRLKRQSTMAVTAKEGAEFLARAGGTREKNVTFDDQVSTTTTPSRPKLQRDSTIDVTVKEGEAFLERMGGMEDVDSATNRIEPDQEKQTTTLSRPKLQRDSTIDVTVKEGEEFLRRSGGMPGNDGNDPKDHSEAAAANEGHETSVGDQGEEEVSSLRRDTTMKETKKIGEAFVGDEGRADSRSQTKLLRQAEQESEPSKTGRAPLKRAGTMDVTKAEGEEFLKRKKT